MVYTADRVANSETVPRGADWVYTEDRVANSQTMLLGATLKTEWQTVKQCL